MYLLGVSSEKIIVSACAFMACLVCQVRSLTNDSGDQEAEAGPSVAVRMLGLSSVPVAGESFEVVADESAVSWLV